ncbi:MAG: hypothetical protein KJ057_16320 [Phycisphaerae bacterium]|nr:hypothetical protein [Planctomycetia bacterium]MCL4720034.1 hypothetical protein [Phycisphaerae bacterium]
MIQVTCEKHEQAFQLVDLVAGRRVQLPCGCVHRVPGEIPPNGMSNPIGVDPHSSTPGANSSAESPSHPSIPSAELGDLAQAVAVMRDGGHGAPGRTAFDAATARTATAVKGTISVLTLLIKDPTALDLAASLSGKSKTRDAGLVCGALFIAAVLLSVFRLMSGGPVDLPASTYLRLAVAPLTVWGGLAAALSISRRFFAPQAAGCMENDVFGAGITVVPIIFAMAVAQILGRSPQTLMFVGGAAIVWSVLILFAALTRLARVPSGLALYIFPLILLGVAFLTDWVIRQLNLTRILL